jgi:hypothetical protein
VPSVRLADGMVTGTFEQLVNPRGVEYAALPPVEPAGESRWYEQFKVPVVECRFTVREATALELDEEYEHEAAIMWRAEWQAESGRLVFDCDCGLDVACREPNLEIEVTDRIVAWQRLRRWRIGDIETGGEWTDD